jgi:hypothetical protein
MESEDQYVTCSLKHTMEHWLWCAVRTFLNLESAHRFSVDDFYFHSGMRGHREKRASRITAARNGFDRLQEIGSLSRIRSISSDTGSQPSLFSP